MGANPENKAADGRRIISQKRNLIHQKDQQPLIIAVKAKMVTKTNGIGKKFEAYFGMVRRDKQTNKRQQI